MVWQRDISLRAPQKLIRWARGDLWLSFRRNKAATPIGSVPLPCTATANVDSWQVSCCLWCQDDSRYAMTNSHVPVTISRLTRLYLATVLSRKFPFLQNPKYFQRANALLHLKKNLLPRHYDDVDFLLAMLNVWRESPAPIRHDMHGWKTNASLLNITFQPEEEKKNSRVCGVCRIK